MARKLKRSSRMFRPERTPDRSDQGIVLESDRIGRWFVMAVAGLIFAVSLGLVVYGISLTPGTFEVTGTSLAQRKEPSGSGRARTYKIVEYIGEDGTLYDRSGSVVRHVQAVWPGGPETERTRVPVYYSRLWKGAVYPRNSPVFAAITVIALVGFGGGALFLYRNRWRLILVRHVI